MLIQSLTPYPEYRKREGRKKKYYELEPRVWIHSDCWWIFSSPPSFAGAPPPPPPPPLAFKKKNHQQSVLNPRNFANFHPKTLRRPNPVTTRLGAPLQIRARSRLIPLASLSPPLQVSASLFSSPLHLLLHTHTHTHELTPIYRYIDTYIYIRSTTAFHTS